MIFFLHFLMEFARKVLLILVVNAALFWSLDHQGFGSFRFWRQERTSEFKRNLSIGPFFDHIDIRVNEIVITVKFRFGVKLGCSQGAFVELWNADGAIGKKDDKRIVLNFCP